MDDFIPVNSRDRMKHSSSKLVSGILVCGAGVGFGVVAFVYFSIYSAAQTWIEVPAYIVDSDPPDGFLGSTTCAYRFQFDGRLHTATSIGLILAEVLFNKSWHHEKYLALDPYIDGKTPFRCFVNPSVPWEAVLFRDVPLSFISLCAGCLLAVNLAGIFLLMEGVHLSRAARHERALCDQHPQKPWLHRLEWATGFIASDRRLKVFSGPILGVLCLLSGLPYLIADGYWLLLNGINGPFTVLILPLVGFTILWLTGGRIAYVLRYGVSYLQIEHGRAILGTTMRAYARTQRPVDPVKGFDAELLCEHLTISEDEDGQSINCKTLWQQRKTFVPLAAGFVADTPGMVLPVQFDLPVELPEVSYNGKKQVRWRLSLAAECPGLNYSASFELPVFRPARIQDREANWSMPLEHN